MSGSGFHVSVRDKRFTSASSIQLVGSGKAFFSALEGLILEAKEEIYFQTYIFESDVTGKKIADALLLAATQHGVKIRLILDDFGSQNFSHELESGMIAAGIEIRKYAKLFSSGRIHIRRRLHSKVIVVDGKTAVVGGINISDQYNDLPGKQAWLDFAVIVRGAVVRQLQRICQKRWDKMNAKKLSDRTIHSMQSEPMAVYLKQIRIRVSQNDFIRRKNEVANAYRDAIRKSSESLIILGGYFLPGGKVRRLIKDANQRGVRMSVIVSEKSDVRLVVYARRYLYAWLIRNGVSIYEYKPSNVHGKILVADRRFVSIGSYDLNNLSTYINIELNLDVDDETFAEQVLEKLQAIMKQDCRLITPAEFKQHHSLWQRFLEWLAYRFAKTLFVLIVWFVSRRDEEK